MTTAVSDPTGYGRVIMDGDEIRDIVEDADADASQRKIKEINTAIAAQTRDKIQNLIPAGAVDGANVTGTLTNLPGTTNNGYLGDVSPMVGAEVKFNATVFHSVETCPFYPTQRPAAVQDVDPQTGEFWTFEPVGGYFNANQDKVAQSTNRASWPPFWPDKLNDPVDPGWSGSWNGYFGKRISADQEAYFVMDDNNDKRFNFTQNNRIAGSGIAFKPDTDRSHVAA